MDKNILELYKDAVEKNQQIMENFINSANETNKKYAEASFLLPQPEAYPGNVDFIYVYGKLINNSELTSAVRKFIDEYNSTS